VGQPEPARVHGASPGQLSHACPALATSRQGDLTGVDTQSPDDPTPIERLARPFATFAQRKAAGAGLLLTASLGILAASLVASLVGLGLLWLAPTAAAHGAESGGEVSRPRCGWREWGVLHEKILIPLDGSEFSAQTLIQLRGLLRQKPTQVRLLTAVDPVPFRFTLRPLRGARDDEVLGARLERAQEALERVQKQLRKEGVEASVSVRKGMPAAAILEEIDAWQPSLVAMTTHGRSGLSEWVYGSVAQRVVRHCPAPLLLLRPQEGSPRELGLKRILVALDGSERADRVLPLAQELAQLHAAEVVLFSAGWSEPSDSAVAYEREMHEVKAEFVAAHTAHVKALRAAGLETKSVVDWGLPAEAIPAALASEEADLFALTTHGRTGVSRFLLGSVAEHVLRACRVPVLLLRTAGE
jgi:nucleotide-binding universal stress UspA family protein